MTQLPIRITNANENAALCGSCGGQCCQRMPGSVLPSDLATEAQQLGQRVQALLSTGRYAIDVHEDWDAVARTELEPAKHYFLRPAVQGYEGRVFDQAWGGACTFHSAIGCELGEDERPGECKLLLPVEGIQCGYAPGWTGRTSAVAAWAPYRNILEDLLP